MTFSTRNLKHHSVQQLIVFGCRLFISLICLFTIVTSAGAKEIKVSYRSKDGKEHSLTFVECPQGQIVLVANFTPGASVPVPTFAIAKHELTMDDYRRIEELVRAKDSKNPLPSLKDLLTRTASIAFASVPTSERLKAENKNKRDKFIKRLDDKTKTQSGKPSVSLPVFGLTFDESQRFCAELSSTFNSTPTSISGLITTEIALPTRIQWQYACRGVSEIVPTTSSLNFQAWPKPADVKWIEAATDKDIARLFTDASELFARLKGKDFAFDKSMGIVEKLKLSTSEEVVQMMTRLLLLERESVAQTNPNIKPATYIEIASKKQLFVCLLREIMRSTISGKANQDRAPILFGVSTVHKIVEGNSDEKKMSGSSLVSVYEMIDKLSDATDGSNSIPNNWQIFHLMGNLPEWVRESSGKTAKPMIVGCGVFDDPGKWQRCLVWHADSVSASTLDKSPAQNFIGLRLVAQRTLSDSYRYRLASSMREISINPEKQNSTITDLKQILLDVKPLVPSERYDSEISPFVEYVLAYVTAGVDANQRQNRAIKAEKLSRSSQPAGATQVPKEEIRLLLANLAFVEGNGTDSQ